MLPASQWAWGTVVSTVIVGWRPHMYKQAYQSFKLILFQGLKIEINTSPLRNNISYWAASTYKEMAHFHRGHWTASSGK